MAYSCEGTLSTRGGTLLLPNTGFPRSWFLVQLLVLLGKASTVTVSTLAPS